jgi:hypothetical protein
LARTKVFVSYSHDDDDWLKRFQQHVAILVRRGDIDVWSDNRIDAGADWESAINEALTSANVAVLLISPAFLASSYIWEHEMPLIMKHCLVGMDVLPLLVRPCAWRLAPDLARLQARPTDDRALSSGSSSEIDLNLAAFTYELAAKVDVARAAAGDKSLVAQTRRANDPVGTWAGYYNRVRPLRLRVVEHSGEQFRGRLEYPNEGTVTTVEGTLHKRLPVNDPIWAQVGGMKSDSFRFGAIFRETSYEIRGGAAISFDGEYRAIVIGREMIGGWYSGRQMIGPITLRRV